MDMGEAELSWLLEVFIESITPDCMHAEASYLYIVVFFISKFLAATIRNPFVVDNMWSNI